MLAAVAGELAAVVDAFRPLAEYQVDLAPVPVISALGIFLPTGPLKPPGSGSGKPDRFDRKPVKTGQIQISNYRRQFNRFPPVSRPV